MKKVLACILFFLLFPHPVFASSSSDNLSLSDIVYADLATRNYLDNVSVYYTDGKTNNDVKLNETRYWLPASTLKTFAAMYAFKRIAEGKLNSHDAITIDAKNNVPTELVTDELPTLMEGDSVTISRLLRQMIIQSDNTAFNVLLDVLGRDNITNYIHSIGLTHSRVGSKLNLDTSQEQSEFDVPGYGINATTAEDYAKAFILIKKNKIPGAKELFAELKDQKINTMIPLFLPKDVVCAHKTGDLDPLYHDGGICQDKKQSYVITIFTNAGDPNLLAHLSELIYTKNYNLIGETLNKKSLGQETQENHPLDPLVMTSPSSFVLGTNTSSLPVIPITAADLGVTAQDLSLIMKDKDLPSVIIPADSSFHIFSDAWQLIKLGVVLDPKARKNVYFETAKLRVAEAKDLEKRGKTKEARIILQNIQQGLTIMAKDTTIAHDSSSQNTIWAISETRFSILADELKNAKGQEKLVLIKEIASQAKDTLKNIQPNIPDATNATNPSQKPLIGEIVNTTPSEVTVKTAGGQEVTIPVNNSIVVKEKGVKGVPSTSPSTAGGLSSLTKGTTVALIGSTTNNIFSPTLVLANIPKELAAPQPVTVARVDMKHDTMVVIENGVYTQVNINKNTSIKGANTNIPLNEIKPGDVVVIHGQPLTQVQSESAKPSITSTPIKKATPTSSVLPSVNPKQNTSTQNTFNPKISNNPSFPSVSTPNKNNPSAVSAPSLPNPKPRVIESTSIRVLEKKEDAAKAPTQPASQPRQEQKSQPQNPPQQSKSQPPAVQPNPPAVNKNEGKKK